MNYDVLLCELKLCWCLVSLPDIMKIRDLFIRNKGHNSFSLSDNVPLKNFIVSIYACLMLIVSRT